KGVLEVVIGDDSCDCVPSDLGLLEAKSQDASLEKHVPYIEETPDGYLVKVGKETKHPMTPEHYIEMIELSVDGVLHRVYLKPEDQPEYKFVVAKGERVEALEYCNIHGLWKS
ncbi:MAG: desulfoferrodoxin family protein, partial [Cetobacterium sp.]